MGLGFSPQGDWLLFCSASSNLGVVDPTPNDEDLFGKNLQTGAVEWFGYGCGWPTWSPDGTKIAFATARDICGWNNNGAWDVLWIDRNAPLDDCVYFHRVSTDSNGNQQFNNGGPMDSVRPMWSPDSTKILFQSSSPFLVPNDTNVADDLFIKTLSNNQTTRVSTNSGGGQASGASERGAWSPDGTRIAFDSRANDLVPGDTNVHEDVFVKNLSNGAVTMVSTNAAGQPTLWPHRNPSWSPDSNSLAWDSEAVDLVPNDANTRRDVFTKNLATGFVQLVSSNANGIQGDSASSAFGSAPRAWSPDGTRIVFTSNAQNLAPNDGNAFSEDIYVKTR
jgi:Tol biopolymer transport system component